VFILVLLLIGLLFRPGKVTAVKDGREVE